MGYFSVKYLDITATHNYLSSIMKNKVQTMQQNYCLTCKHHDFENNESQYCMLNKHPIAARDTCKFHELVAANENPGNNIITMFKALLSSLFTKSLERRA